MSGLHTHYSEATVPLDKKEGADYNWRCVKPADDLFYRELGRRIRALRTEHGLTQAGLGLRLEPPVTRAAIANVENGKQRVLAHTLVQLAQIFRVEIKSLVAPLPNPRSASVQQQVLERELKKKLVVSGAALKRLSTRLMTQS